MREEADCPGGPGRTDDVGIVRLADGDEPWPDVPAPVVEAALRSPDADGIVDFVLDGHRPWPARLQRRLLHPASGAAASIVPLADGATALDLGTGWGCLPVALDALGSRVVRADWVYARLRFNHLMHRVPSASAVHLPVDGRLPWADETFDVAFVDLGEVWRAATRRSDPRDVMDSLLAELRRVLARDGVTVVGTRRGQPQEGRTAWRRTPGEDTLLRAGLRSRRVVVPYPSRDRLRWLVPRERLADHLWRVASPSRSKRAAARLVSAVGLGALIVPEFFVVADRSENSRSVVRTLGEVLLGADGHRSPVTMALTDARVAVVGPHEFAKVPLSPSQRSALVGELEKTALARATAFAPYVVPTGRLADLHGVQCCVYPRVLERRSSPDELRGIVHTALRGIDPTVVGPLGSTVWWRRLTGERARDDATETGAAALRDTALATLGDAVVPVGPTHGDLHAGNVLVPASGRPLLVDWNRFETHNPLLLDAVYAAVRDHMRGRPGATLAQGLLDFVEGRTSGPLSEHAHRVTGDLSPLEAVTVVLLDRVVSYSLPRRRHKPWTMQPLQQACEAVVRATARPLRDVTPPSPSW